ncbi:LOW QUALITY PROTEIN: olfactory receptor 14A16-like [Tachyglossus aculeatus]|uniref:LOW QUALITY PROTEIN: olfactory receptor 14A16-like n=1 Tax=Tachyglossus aculeatus TaxID=9261 RepID=UPI0018F7ACCF|nr:LOW QUALITY PROTEIN: olfactory receptor 14A16-like [Tachyglossus aculeatus]
MSNVSMVMEFLLLGFSEVQELQLVHAALFLLFYLVALTGNLLIVTITALDQHLHTPKDFFLRHLSLLDLCNITTTVPKSILNSSLTNSRSISFQGCTTQVFLLILFGGSEVFILTAMSYDRYAAICCPLRYDIIMNREGCAKMAAASWLSGSLYSLMHTATTFSSHFCAPHIIHQFFCELPQFLKLMCPGEARAEVCVPVLSVILCLGCFVFILVSYVHIFLVVLKMPSTEGRTKAFSTCLPHLAVVTLYFFTSVFANLKPPSSSPSTLDLLLSVFYTVLPPTLNPLIYSLRNQDMKAVLGKIFSVHFISGVH